MVADRQASTQLRFGNGRTGNHLGPIDKSFGEVEAAQALSFTIDPGTIFGFLGANGAGKTTTIRMLSRADSPHWWECADCWT